MGVDPGSACTGWGVLALEGNRLDYRASGVVKMPRPLPLHERLLLLHRALDEVVTEHAPQQMAVEEVFYARNVRSALVLAHARGVVLLAASAHGLELAEYSARLVKQALVGYGNAEKHQVQDMVQRLLAPGRDMGEDESDALAVAVCHAHRSNALLGARRSGAGQRPRRGSR